MKSYVDIDQGAIFDFVEREGRPVLVKTARAIATRANEDLPGTRRHPRARGSYGARDTEAGVEAGTDYFAGHIVEFGSSKTPALAPLRNACDALGLPLEET